MGYLGNVLPSKVARFFEGVFFTELGDAVAVTRRRDDARVSGLVLRGPMGSDLEQALAAISDFCLPFTFHFFFFVATFGFLKISEGLPRWTFLPSLQAVHLALPLVTKGGV